MRVNIRQVADKAGVSAMTVSRVLNGQADKVAEATRERILQVVRELDYVPVAQPAGQQRNKRTRVIGLVFDQLDEVRDYVGSEIYVGLREGARHHGYDLLTLLREGPDWAGEREEVRFLDRRSDGLIFVNPFRRYDLLERLQKHHIPLVSCCGYDVPVGVATVAVAGEPPMQLLCTHLYEQGHRKLGFIAGPVEQGADSRRNGFLQALEKLGLQENSAHIFPGTNDTTWQPDQRALAAALDAAKRKKLTALLCANDYLAAALGKVAAKRGIQIPGDLAVTGFDDVPVAERRGLTTVHHPFMEIGRLAVDALLAMLDGRDAEAVSHHLPASLVVRESTGPVVSKEDRR